MFLLGHMLMQFSYNIALNSCQCLLKNYTKINKFSDPKDYEGKIVFLSSNKPKYQNIYDKQFNMNFKAAYVKSIMSRCLANFGRNNHIEYVWSSVFNFVNASYSFFSIGNFTIDTKTFPIYQMNLQTFIPSEEEVKNFEKSPASEKYYYLKRGYFFDKSFPSTNLKRKLNDCTPNDKMIEFKVFNSGTISVLGVIDGGRIKHFNYYSIDFSGIFDEKISLNEYVNNFMTEKKKQAYSLRFIALLILLILSVFCNRIYFSVITLSIMIIFTLNIKAYCLYNFPIKFKILFTTTITILLSLLFIYSNRIPQLINILLLEYVN